MSKIYKRCNCKQVFLTFKIVLANSNTVEVITLVYAASAKKNKGSDILDFDRKIIFSEQDIANYFLLISSFSLNTVKF